ncbi:WAT1-related protein [Sesamum alatum]|uniref:WAT1-related protein n=1 Tax=Sesamum alatum TaxID=300844 RepID=A0AAE2CJE2_9LAMI|nr:WAT1-related protein [Sesamum alatum]
MAALAKICNTLHGLKPTLIMVMVQTILAVVNIGYKLAANDGMRLPILVAYRFMFGAAFILPIAFFVERKKRPKLTWNIAFSGFFLGLLGLERLGLNTAAGKAKVLGTIMGISGAMLLTLYKGPQLNLWNTNINLLKTTTTHHHANGPTLSHAGGHNLVLGALLALASCVCYSLWLIIQAKASEHYPCPYSITAMMTVWASLQSVPFALCVERDWSNWILGWDIRLLTVAVAGVVGSGLLFTVVAWCVRMRGPLFVSIFNPLLLVIVAIAGSLFLEEKLHLGMVLGAILIVGGLYVVLWGKGKELKKVSQLMPENQENQVAVDMPPPRWSGSSHGGSSRKGAETEEEREEDKRDSHASSEVLGGLYIYP